MSRYICTMCPDDREMPGFEGIVAKWDRNKHGEKTKLLHKYKYKYKYKYNWDRNKHDEKTNQTPAKKPLYSRKTSINVETLCN